MDIRCILFQGHQQYGFTSIVIISTLLHLVVFIPLLYHRQTSRDIFITPMYTVDLVSLPQERPNVQEIKKKKEVSKVKEKTKKKVIKKEELKTSEKERAKRITEVEAKVEKIKEIEGKQEISEALKEIEREAKLKEEDLRVKKIIATIEDREKRKEEEAEIEQEFERFNRGPETKGLTELKEKVSRFEKKSRIKELELEALESIEELREKERLREDDIISTTAYVPELPVGKRLLASRGTVDKGSELFDIQFADYYSEIWQKIQESWILPKNIPDDLKGLETIVGITIRRNGGVLAKKIEKSSGSIQYDESVLRAIEKSEPLPPLPEGFRGKNFEVGIRFRVSQLFTD